MCIYVCNVYMCVCAYVPVCHVYVHVCVCLPLVPILVSITNVSITQLSER